MYVFQAVELWSGELSNAAETILHQHKVQGDLTDIQDVVCRWLVYSRFINEYSLNYDVLFNLLTKLDAMFKPGQLTADEVRSDVRLRKQVSHRKYDYGSFVIILKPRKRSYPRHIVLCVVGHVAKFIYQVHTVLHRDRGGHQ
jgi:hypothetical protein